MKRVVAMTTVLLVLFTLNMYARGRDEAQSGPVTLMTNYTGVGKIDHGLAWHFLREDLGIEIDRTTQTQEALQTAIAGGSLPDFISFKHGAEQFFQAVEAGLLVNLDEHRDKLPHVFANIAAGLEYNRDQVRTRTNGRLTGAYAVPGDTTNRLGWTTEKYNVGPYVRWDYYYQLGCPELTSIDDYIPLAQAMLARFPTDENGRANVGFSFEGGQDADRNTLLEADRYVNMHGQILKDFLEIDVANNTYRSIFDDTSYYKKGLQFLFNANQAGVLDPNAMTQRFEGWHEKTATGRVLVNFTAYSWTNFFTDERERAGIYYGFVPFANEKIARTAQLPVYTPGVAGGYAISAKTKNLDKALALLDYLASYDGWAKLYYGLPGIEGGTWDLVNGKPVPRGTHSPEATEGFEVIGGGAAYPLYNAEYQQNDVRGILHLNLIHPAWGETLYYLGWKSWEQPPNMANKFVAQRWEVYGKYGIENLGAIELAQKMGIEVVVPSHTMDAPPENIVLINSRVGDANVTAGWRMIMAANQAEFDRIWRDLQTQARGLGADQSVQWYWDTYQRGKSSVQKYIDIWNNTPQLQ